MEIEVYRKQEVGHVAVPQVSFVEESENEERLTLYRILGFKGLEEIATCPDPADWYPEIFSEEYETWRSFLPTSYRNRNFIKPAFGYGRDYEHFRWEHYCFDEVPLSILRELETASNLNFFKFIEIRTPQRSHSDPIAIGHYSMPDGADRCFLICRWGESLIPYSKIYKIVHGTSAGAIFFGLIFGATVLIVLVALLKCTLIGGCS